jgi:hypothetical protein
MSRIHVFAQGSGIYRVLVEPPPGARDIGKIELSAQGGALVSLDTGTGTGNKLVKGPGVSAIVVDRTKKILDLEFEIGAKNQMALQVVTPVREASFSATDSESVERNVSAIKSGTITWRELGDRKTDLRPYESVSIAPEVTGTASRGFFLRDLELDKDVIRARFFGRVKSINRSDPKNGEEMMPSLLEIADANNRLNLLWSAGLVVVGFVVSALRWTLLRSGDRKT